MCVALESFQYIFYNNAKFLKNGALNIILARKNQIAFYRPQTKLRKGNVFIPVCDSVHRGEVYTLLGRHPSHLDRHPQADTHLGRPPLYPAGIKKYHPEFVNRQIFYYSFEITCDLYKCFLFLLVESVRIKQRQL